AFTALAHHRRRPFLTRDLVASVRSDAARVRADGVESHAECLRGVFGAAAGCELHDDRFLHRVRALRRRAARGATRTALARGDVECFAELRQPPLHLLVRLELVDEAAFETTTDAGEL